MKHFPAKYILASLTFAFLFFLIPGPAFGNRAHPDPGWHVEKANYSFNPVQTLSGIGTIQDFDMYLEQTAISPATLFQSPSSKLAPRPSTLWILPEPQRDIGALTGTSPGIIYRHSENLDNSRYLTAKTNRQYDFEPGGI